MAIQCVVCGFSKETSADHATWPKSLTAPAEIYPVTKDGNPSGILQAFLCARCLTSANKMREYIKAAQSGVIVSVHAVSRYAEREKGERIDDERIRVTIIRILLRARRIRFKDFYMAQRKYNNGGRPANYWYHNGWVLVTTKDIPATIVTVERTGAKKLGMDFWYVSDLAGGD